MKLKFKKLADNAKCPDRAYEDAAAWDMYASTMKVVDGGDHGYIEYGTGIAMEIPSGMVGKIFPRSSLSKTGMILANHVGIIDPDYRGEITFRFKWIPGTKQYAVGDKIGQFRLEKTIPITWVESDTLSETVRGEGGYGSSDNKEN